MMDRYKGLQSGFHMRYILLCVPAYILLTHWTLSICVVSLLEIEWFATSYGLFYNINNYTCLQTERHKTKPWVESFDHLKLFVNNVSNRK